MGSQQNGQVSPSILVYCVRYSGPMTRTTWGSFRCSNSSYIDVVQVCALSTALYEDQRFLEPS
jgi:hypothetical protein